MGQGRLAKILARGVVVSWREQPTQYDIEALRANTERVGLVIRVRWAIVVALAVFSVVASIVYGSATEFGEFVSNLTIPAIALVFVLMYNGLYQSTYRKVGNVAFLNQAQLLFDMIVVTVLVYYSGGVYSWFSAMYLLFILEGAFILPRRGQVWLLVAAAAFMYGIVIFGELWGWFSHVELPFTESGLQLNGTYVLVRYLWKITLYGGAATIGLLMMKTIRAREDELKETSFVDDLTGLLNRQYFYRVLPGEIERTRRSGRDLALILADIDRFGDINRTFGVETGDALLAATAVRLREAAAGTVEDPTDVSIACRIGGEELALLVPEVPREDELEPLAQRIVGVAEAFRIAVEGTRVNGVGVTVSVGVALAPRDGSTPDALLDAADAALSRAAAAGGNRVCTAETGDRCGDV